MPVVTMIRLALLAPLPLAGAAAFALTAPAPPRQTPFWTVDTVPSVRIGSVTGDEAYTFTYLSSVSRAADGRLVAMDDGQRRIRVFDARGRHVTTLGRPGDGPGEFGPEHVQARVLNGDTIGAYEPGRARLQLFTIAGGYVRAFQADEAALRKRVGGGDDPRARLIDGGGFLVLAAPREGARPVFGAVVRTPTRFFRASSDLGELRSLGTYPAGEQVSFPEGRSRSTTGIPFGAAYTFAWDPAGRRVCLGDTQQPRVDCFDNGGATTTVSWPHSPEAIPDSAVKAWKTGLLDRDSRSTDARRMIGGVEIKDTKPAHRGVVVDSDLNLWVERYAGAERPGRTFTVFDRAGRMLGNVAMPPMRVQQIHGDAVIGIATDDEGVQSIVIHRLRKSGRGGTTGD